MLRKLIPGGFSNSPYNSIKLVLVTTATSVVSLNQSKINVRMAGGTLLVVLLPSVAEQPAGGEFESVLSHVSPLAHLAMTSKFDDYPLSFL